MCVVYNLLGYVISDIPYYLEKGAFNNKRYDIMRFVQLLVGIFASIVISEYIVSNVILHIAIGILSRQTLEDILYKEVYELPLIFGSALAISSRIISGVTSLYVIVLVIIVAISFLNLYGRGDLYAYGICCSLCIDDISIINILLLSNILSIICIIFKGILNKRNIMIEKIPLLPIIFISTIVVLKWL